MQDRIFELRREHDHDANPTNEVLIKHLREVEESRRHFSPLKSPRTPRDDVLDTKISREMEKFI